MRLRRSGSVGHRNGFALVAAVVLGLLFAAPVTAATIQVTPGKSLAMDAPGGQCLVDPSVSPYDAQYFAQMGTLFTGNSQLIGLFAECAALASLRQGTPHLLTQWTTVLLPLVNGQVPDVSPYTRAQIIDEMAKTIATSDMQQYVDNSAPGMEERIAALLEGGSYDLSEARSLGLLQKDATAVYSGMIMAQSLNGVQQRIACVIALTTVGGNIVSLNLYRPYVDAGTFTALLAEAKGLMADLVAKNDPVAANGTGSSLAGPESPVASVKGFTPSSEADTASSPPYRGIFGKIGIAVTVLLVGGLIGFFFARRRSGKSE